MRDDSRDNKNKNENPFLDLLPLGFDSPVVDETEVTNALADSMSNCISSGTDVSRASLSE